MRLEIKNTETKDFNESHVMDNLITRFREHLCMYVYMHYEEFHELAVSHDTTSLKVSPPPGLVL